MKFFRAIALCLLLVACSAPISDNQASYDNAKRLALKAKADQGDKDAQYELGNSYCCGNSGFWDTNQAIIWWCKAAEQGQERAKMRLLQVSATCTPKY